MYHTTTDYATMLLRVVKSQVCRCLKTSDVVKFMVVRDSGAISENVGMDLQMDILI